MTRKDSILMVDDDKEDRDLIKDTFEELGYGYSIHFEENGEKAIAYLQQCRANNCTPCLVVLDLNMPILNGRQTLHLIKNDPLFEHLTVMIYSTSLNPMERDECLALGAHSYVVKPVTYEESIRVANLFYTLCKEREDHTNTGGRS